MNEAKAKAINHKAKVKVTFSSGLEATWPRGLNINVKYNQTNRLHKNNRQLADFRAKKARRLTIGSDTPSDLKARLCEDGTEDLL